MKQKILTTLGAVISTVGLSAITIACGESDASKEFSSQMDRIKDVFSTKKGAELQSLIDTKEVGDPLTEKELGIEVWDLKEDYEVTGMSLVTNPSDFDEEFLEITVEVTRDLGEEDEEVRVKNTFVIADDANAAEEVKAAKQMELITNLRSTSVVSADLLTTFETADDDDDNILLLTEAESALGFSSWAAIEEYNIESVALPPTGEEITEDNRLNLDVKVTKELKGATFEEIKRIKLAGSDYLDSVIPEFIVDQEASWNAKSIGMDKVGYFLQLEDNDNENETASWLAEIKGAFRALDEVEGFLTIEESGFTWGGPNNAELTNFDETGLYVLVIKIADSQGNQATTSLTIDIYE